MENEAKDDDFKVEVVDDTPAEDVGRKPLPKEVVEDFEKDDLEEYSEKVKNRIAVAKKAFHDERREKEKAHREHQEALRFAQQALEENKFLKQRLSVGEKIFAKETTEAAQIQVTSAKEAYRLALEGGDPAKISETQEAFFDAKMKLKEASSFRPTLQDPESGVQNTPQTQNNNAQPTFEPKTEAWRKKNTWFGSDTEMTALALGLHEKLVREGVVPSSDEYFDKIDRTMRKRFPENFEDAQTTEEKSSHRNTATKPTVVASVSRTSAPRQIKISASQAALAKRLGITPEAYAREFVKQYGE
jgi:hypothetical protein